MKVKKRNKKRIDDIAVYTAGIIMVVIMTLLITNVVVELLVETNYNKNKITNYTQKETIIAEAKKAIEEKEFCNVLVEFQDNIPYSLDGNEYTGHVTTYTYKTNKDKSKVMYSYVDQNEADSTLLEFWSPTEGGYDIYIWSTEADSYVKTFNAEEPVTVSTWDVLDNLGKYNLESNEGLWGEQEEPCYILSIYGKNNSYDTIGQYLYISRKTLLPMGIVTAAADYTDSDVTIKEDGSTIIDGVTKDGEQTEHSEAIVRMSYVWTSIDSIDFPTLFKTEEEFYEILENGK